MMLYLVRHGQSEGNVLKSFHGQTDYPLTPLGREQAARAGEKLREVTFSRCLASDLSRAWETARICLAGRDVPIEPAPDLREQDIGELEGLSWEEMEARFPVQLRTYLEDWWSLCPPGGESPAEMTARVERCLRGVLDRGEDTLLVAHNGSLTLILELLGLADRSQLLKPGWFFAQGTYTAISAQPGGARLVCFNR